ncbi:LCP family glycopolymer transferase [Actinocorallia populi]|uniref:LCP family glycopolymer transferase n=1 Tax=Actinocorallia populi TaxID=2079200 RepID=UPI001E63CB82|nr:LCP family protein [Actinocorallia populi]
MARRRRRDGLPSALALTAASTLLWGVAHLRTGRVRTGAALLVCHTAIAGLAATVPLGHRPQLLRLAFSPGWLAVTATAGLVLAAVWVGVVVRSWFLVRPARMPAPRRAAASGVVLLLCLAVSTPFVVVAHATFLYRGALLSIFTSSDHARADGRSGPWAGLPRLNVLLLGGDAGRNRFGVRTDSITLASVDTRTGDTVLMSLPRNLERVPMPPGPARERFPDGFAGDGPMTPGMLNEVYQYAEDHPEVVPGVPRDSRGPALLRPVVEAVLGQPVHHHVLVDMRGFAMLIDAMGGVEVTIPEDIAYGRRDEGLLPAGRHRLTGTQALWYGRSRTGSDDYVRMARQKCLMRAMARQAEPHRLLPRFQQLVTAARRTVSTDIPPSLLPAFLELAEKVKSRGRITSLPFVPPLIDPAGPDYDLIRARAARAVAKPGRQAPTAAVRTAAPATASPTSPDPARPVSLDEACPS